MVYLLCLDPGVTTGIAYGQYDPNEKQLAVKVGQLKFSHEELYDFLRETDMHYLIYERFDYRNAYTKADLTPVEMIGIIKLFCEERDISVYDQMPTVQGSTAYWTDDRLRKYNVYARGYEHGRSATKHLLYWWQFGRGYGFHEQADFTNYVLETMPK